jgi:hypothetical protein
MKKSYECEVGAAMLADVPAGESPVGGACSVATVVIPDDEKGNRLVRKLGSKSLCRPGEIPGRIRQGGKQLDRP